VTLASHCASRCYFSLPACFPVESPAIHLPTQPTAFQAPFIFGPEDILINNIAWFVRHRPVFGIPGDGRYGIRPIYVEDMAKLIVDSVEQQNSGVINAVGPETFTFEELVRRIASELDKPARVVHVPTVAATSPHSLPDCC
jgi:nucleoside-diphosphate-sugar epimerase